MSFHISSFAFLCQRMFLLRTKKFPWMGILISKKETNYNLKDKLWHILIFWNKRKTWKGIMIRNVLTRRREYGTYLATALRHRRRLKMQTTADEGRRAGWKLRYSSLFCIFSLLWCLRAVARLVPYSLLLVNTFLIILIFW